MKNVEHLPKDIRSRLRDPHDELGRWLHVHPGLMLTDPMTIHTVVLGSALPDRPPHKPDAVRFGVHVGAKAVASMIVSTGRNGRGDLLLRVDPAFLENFQAWRIVIAATAPQSLRILREPTLNLRFLWARHETVDSFYPLDTLPPEGELSPLDWAGVVLQIEGLLRHREEATFSASHVLEQPLYDPSNT